MSAPRARAGLNAPMRQTPFGVWNLRGKSLFQTRILRSNEADAFRRLEFNRRRGDVRLRLEAPMRQTPFGVWNAGQTRRGALALGAPMRQTPFGVWNPRANRRIQTKPALLQ